MTSFDEPGSLVNDQSVHMEYVSSPQPLTDEEKCTKISMYEQQIRIFDARKDYLLNMLEIEKTGSSPSTATMEKLNAEMRNIDGKIKNLEGLMARNLKRKRTSLDQSSDDELKILMNLLDAEKKTTALLKDENEKLQAQQMTFLKKIDFYKAVAEKCKATDISSDKIISYLKNDYCFVCLAPAKLRCCSNHNYCSAACRSFDTSEHGNCCPLKLMNLSSQDLPFINQLGVLGSSVTIQRRTRSVMNFQFEVKRSSEVICTTEENGPSTSGEMITESSSDSDEDEDDSDEDEAETEEEQAETGDEEEQAETGDEEEQAETEEEHVETEDEEEQAETEDEEEQAETEDEEEQAETDEEPDHAGTG
ncbi:hypothetical protein TNCT_365681 [Trichonephila clavata]|uniref:MYND-type domain-containing protein n=1 Tax=Trichonephila clavata TaxID=2740835 RepID=A0A8X6HF44_TRICU|nr:hypothetical protein TNCT_365681 [Trichonephila clavata]